MVPTSPAKTETFRLLVADVFEAAGALRRVGEELAATEGQTQARWQVMSVVSEGEWTVPAAAGRLGVSRQAVQRIANELVDERLARFEDNPRHRRSPFLRLSADGTRALDTITRRADVINAELVGGLTGAELQRCRSTLSAICTAARGHLGEAAGDE
jgi:DNA-binding MarR family transcriptional regulator